MPRISPPVSLFRAQICPVSRFLCAAAPAVNGTTISPPLMVSIFDYFLFSRRTVTFLWIFSTNSHLKRRVDLSNDSGVLNWKCCFWDGMGWAIKFLKCSTISLVYGNSEKRSWHESVKLGYFSSNIITFWQWHEFGCNSPIFDCCPITCCYINSFKYHKHNKS